MNESEKKIINNIEEYGCHVTSVFDPEERDPDFTYSIGIYKVENQPELLVLGLRHELSSWIVNEYNRRIKEGEKFVLGEYYEGFIEGFQVTFQEVADKYKNEFMLSCNWLYGGINYPVMQLVFPSVKGLWPWEKEASEGFKILQPSFQEKSAW